ncbi:MULTISPECIES: 3'-5' exonuclease [Pseudomonadati]|uniref:3'-5' exonuclease n=1 Tax=unclassified Halobacteriovorax TaxID=2639665 RepID=UPI000CD123DF|nr:3'-5' exonuclease [Halobacteriovorax sp. DA5]POB14620.1 histidine kinase [Halobacteriovorax sp. DA5]
MKNTKKNTNNIKARITKEEINSFEMIDYTGQIHLIDTEQKAQDISKRFQELNQKYNCTGLDTESRPSFKKTDNFRISLIQVSFEDECFLFRLNKIQCPDYLVEYLEDENLIKTGVAVKDDCRDLKKQYHINAKGVVDVQDLAKAQGYITLGLQSLTGILLEKKISKKAKLTNWENNKLTDAQIRYAATDAWISLKLYQALDKKD